MEYKIEKINRTITLNDDIVNEFRKYDELRDSIFTIILRSKFENDISEQKVSKIELSAICNDILIHELKAMALLPAAISTYFNNFNSFKAAADKQECVEVDIGGDVLL